MARDLAIADVARTFESIEAVKEALRQSQWSQALRYLPGIRKALVSIGYRDSQLGQHQAGKLQAAVEFLEYVEHSIYVNRQDVAVEAIHDFIQGLIELQTTLAELENNVFRSDPEGR